MLGALPYTQPTDITNQGGFYPKVVEDALDRTEIQIQQLAETTSRSVSFPVSEAVSGILPAALQRAGTVLAFDSLGNLTFLPMPSSVGAGDLRDELGSDGKPGLIVGTDVAVGATQIPLSRSPGSKANLWLFFDTENQGGDQIQSVANSILTLTSGVPAGISRVYIRTGTTLSVYTPPPQSVTDASVAPGTALYDRIANNFSLMDPRFTAGDDAARVQKALDFVGQRGGGVVYVGDGVSMTLARSVYFNYPNVSLYARNRYANTFKAAASATSIDAQAMFKVQAANCSLEGIGIDGNIESNVANVFGAVFAQEQSGVIVRNCYIRNVIGAGVTLFAITGANSNSSFDITDNRIENVGAEGITVLYGVNGRIERNDIFRTGLDGIRTDGVFGNLNLGVSFNLNIVENSVNKSVPPSHIRGGTAEGGFMIVYGAGDKYVFVQDNFCYDNRNAGNDGIGLGQDGAHTNQGCIVQGNVVVYAGLFGIDATNQSTVQNNVILLSTQCGIKVGTDLGGNCTNCLIDGNLIIQPNNPTALYPSTQNMGIQVFSGHPPGVYSGIKIRNNTVLDSRTGAAQYTKYGLSIVFEAGVTMSDNEFSGNDFSQVGTAGVFADGTGAANPSGWRWKNNTYPLQVVPVTGVTPNVFGCENVTLSQSGATTVTNLIGGYEGMTLDVQMNDSNTTFKFNSNANMYGNGNTNLTAGGGNWMQFKYLNNVWAGYRTVQ
ncbi:right-handed parallel beta-helix repeat-containing protein [Paraburkholderia sp. RL17-368-BIF-A]|uniref:hypothetical protein n=1 Tax=Paraburkholderia sp. RL17-368-BIF-A TaxID=3031628 RepID=UPI0038CD1CE5